MHDLHPVKQPTCIFHHRIIILLAILVPDLDHPIRGGADEDARLERVPLQAVHWAVVGLSFYICVLVS